MSTRTIEVSALSVRATVNSVDERARTVELIFSTGAAVDRTDYGGRRYREVLSMKPDHVRLDRLNAGAPLLNSHAAHSIDGILGTVERGTARIVNGQGVARVRFSKRAEAEEIWRDVVDGIITSVSVGYRVHRLEEQPAAGPDAIATRLATDWEPYELSLVAMPADPGARVRGDLAGSTNPCLIVHRSSITDEDRLLRLRRAQLIECGYGDVVRAIDRIVDASGSALAS